jgi:RNA polymerase sigma factor (sigma-70 family)
MKDDIHWLDMINSPNAQTRLEALGEFLFDETHGPKDALLAFLSSRLNSRALAEDLFQRTVEKVLKQLRRAPLSIQHPHQLSAYVWRAARNQVNDYYRKVKDESSSLEPRHETLASGGRIESSLQQQWYRDRLRNLIPRLPDEEAHLTLILLLAGYNFRQISCLVPWSIRKIQRMYNDSVLLLKSQLSIDPEYSLKPNRWDRLLTFGDGSGHLGLAYIEAQPRNFAAETAHVLCQTFELSSIGQLQAACRPLLVIHEAYSDQPIVQLAFTDPNGMNLNTLRGKPLHYLGGIPSFEREDNKTGESLRLLNLQSYKGHVTGAVTNADMGVEYLDWLYDIAGAKMQVIKMSDAEEFGPTSRVRQPLVYFRAREFA